MLLVRSSTVAELDIIPIKKYIRSTFIHDLLLIMTSPHKDFKKMCF